MPQRCFAWRYLWRPPLIFAPAVVQILPAMQLFYQPGLKEGPWLLSEEETRHAIGVLRHRVGDRLRLIDGEGGWFTGEIVGIGKRDCQLMVYFDRRDAARAPYRLTLAVAPTKQMERLEWLVEKATETGIDEIVPLLTQRGERQQLRIDRLAKEAIAAAKQSLQAWAPRIAPPTRLRELFAQRPQTEQRFIGWCESEDAPLLARNCKPLADVMVLIGPEGDFTAEEVGFAQANGCLPISLGPTRLRTETAALAACMTVQLINQLKNH